MLGLVLMVYANDNGGDFPPLSSKPGRLIFDKDAVYPEYLSDPEMLISLSDPVRKHEALPNVSADFCFENSSFCYLGYEVWDDESVEAFVAAYLVYAAEGEALGEGFAPQFDWDPLPKLQKPNVAAAVDGSQPTIASHDA